jgi:hypothetical protein
VELLGTYWNQDFLVSRLNRVLALPIRPRAMVVRPPKQIQCRLSPDQVTDLVQRYQAGELLHELATEFGVHRETASRHLKRRGVDSRYRLLEPNLDEARRLYEAGWSLARVGDHFAINASTVFNAFRRAGVPMRPGQGGPSSSQRPTRGG